MGNKSLHRAKERKKDEFYTQYEEIEEEMKYYKDYFKGKRVFLNCDDPRKSHFWLFFKDHFDEYGLEKLTAMYYLPDEKVYKYEMFEGEDEKGALRHKQTPVEGDGSFQSEESLGVLEESDVVVTNPPFSEWIPFIDLLLEYDKDFIILGRQTALGYKNVFSYMKEGILWTGVKVGKVMEFRVPKSYQYEDGLETAKVPSISWYTNIEHEFKEKRLELEADYDGGKYEVFDNYPAINVNRLVDIPKDYAGVMGVPMTVMNNIDRNQFELVGYRYGEDGKGLRVDGKEKFTRILIRNKTLDIGKHKC